jgi:hypothetical protein
VLEKYTVKLDDGKKKRLDELMSDAKGGGSGAAATQNGTTAPSMAARAVASTSPTGATKSMSGSGSRRTAVTQAVDTAGPSRALNSAGPAAAPVRKAVPVAAAASGASESEDTVALAAGALNRDGAIAALTELFGETLVAKLQDAQWKVCSLVMKSMRLSR